MIRLRFVTGNNFVSNAIRSVTWSAFSHVEFCIPKGYFPDYPDGGYLGAHADGGVKLRPLDYDKDMSSEIFGTIACDDVTTNKALNFAYSQIGKPYDYSAILGILIHRDIFSDSAWVCSELVCWALEKAKFPILNISKVNRVTPAMLLISPLISYDTALPDSFRLRF